MKFNSFLEKKNSINLHTFCCKSSLDSAFKYHSNNFGKTGLEDSPATIFYRHNNIATDAIRLNP